MKNLKESFDLQGHLTDNRVKYVGSYDSHITHKPTSSLSDLMQWVCNFFAKTLDAKSVKKYINNKISIDGDFLQYCEENKVEVSCLYHDGLATWDSSYNNEHFTATGVFLIKKGKLNFIHAGLFHKGNQNEDEISFFVIVPDDSLREYINFRNDFEIWENERDRFNLEIEVIGGDPIPYSKDLTWDDIYLEDETKEQIIRSVDGFMKSKDACTKLKVPWKRGLIFWGPRGNGKTSTLKVIMSMYDIKPVTIYPGHQNTEQLLEEAFIYAQEHSPALLFFEDFQEMMMNVDSRLFLNLMDGVQSRDGLLTIATGNDFSKLEDNIISRPRRFDKRIEFPLPSLDITEKYLNKWFEKYLEPKDILDIALKSVKNEFTFSHLQEIYFNAASISIRKDYDEPTRDDIFTSMKEVSKEKLGLSDETPPISIMGYNE